MGENVLKRGRCFLPTTGYAEGNIQGQHVERLHGTAHADKDPEEATLR